MDLLQQKGFFGHELVAIATPLLVERYNACLRALGKEETKLSRFSIDGAGWSPQIAKEKNDRDYLCHGEANLYAILMTPNQKGKPVYAPMHSFDAAILQTVHDANARAINNLTSRTAIILDIDQGVDAYDSPLDLLMLDTFTVRAFTPDYIMKGAREQKALVARFRKEEGAWQDEKLIEELIHSARTLGDLRHSALQIAPTPFHDIANFYTRAMGELYVLRDCRGSTHRIVAVMGESSDNNVARDIFSLPRDWGVFLSRLMDLGFLTPRKSEFSKDLVEQIDQTLELLLAKAAYDEGLDSDFSKLNRAELAGWKNRLRSKLPKAYVTLHKVAKELRRGRWQGFSEVGIDVWVHVLRPNDQLSESTQAVLWHLLARLQPHNVEMAYRHNKSLFYERYQSWPKAQRDWALNHLTRLGLPHHE